MKHQLHCITNANTVRPLTIGHPLQRTPPYSGQLFQGPASTTVSIADTSLWHVQGSDGVQRFECNPKGVWEYQ